VVHTFNECSSFSVHIILFHKYALNKYPMQNEIRKQEVHGTLKNSSPQNTIKYLNIQDGYHQEILFTIGVISYG